MDNDISVKISIKAGFEETFKIDEMCINILFRKQVISIMELWKSSQFLVRSYFKSDYEKSKVERGEKNIKWKVK